MKQIKFTVIIIIAFILIQNKCFSQYHEGDTLKFWSVTYIDWPPLQGSPQREINAICKKAGDHCYVFVEDQAVQPNQLQINELVDKFDNHFYDSLTNAYGPVPNAMDNDSNIFILILNEENWGGYYDPGQQMADTFVYSRWNRHSSEREIIYVGSSSFSYAEMIVAHEFGHLLHWQQDHSPDPVVNPTKYWEDAWVDEGFSTFAAIYLTENIFQENVLDNQAFFANNPDIPLIYFSDYNQVELFMLFMFEHFGKWNYISALISNQLNGIDGINSALNQLGYTELFDDAFEQWVIANYIDDLNYENGKYSYLHYNFPACFISANHTSFPTGTKTKTINPYGADYISFTSSTPKPISISFSGQPNSKYRVDFILKNTTTNHTDSVISISLDNSNQATFIANGLGTTYNNVVMAVMNTDSTIHENNTASYSYSATTYTGIENINKNTKVLVYPNPVKETLNIALPHHLASKLEIVDLQGRVCISSQLTSNISINTSNLANGIYILHILSSKESYTEKIVLDK